MPAAHHPISHQKLTVFDSLIHNLQASSCYCTDAGLFGGDGVGCVARELIVVHSALEWVGLSFHVGHFGAVLFISATPTHPPSSGSLWGTAPFAPFICSLAHLLAPRQTWCACLLLTSFSVCSALPPPLTPLQGTRGWVDRVWTSDTFLKNF